MDNLFLSNNVKENKGEKNKRKNKKRTFNQYKEQTVKSLYEVENFLIKTKNVVDKFKIVKIIK